MNGLIILSEAGASAGVSATKTMIDVSGVDFSCVLNEMVALLPTMLPVAVACIGFRKGIAFILSFVRGV